MVWTVFPDSVLIVDRLTREPRFEIMLGITHLFGKEELCNYEYPLLIAL